MALLKQSTSYVRVFAMVDSADHFSAKTGLTVVVNLSKAGAAFGAAAGAVAEIGNGMYKVTLSTADSGTVGDLAYHCTSAGADDTQFVDQVSAGDIANLDAAVSSRPTAAAVATAVWAETTRAITDKAGFALSAGGVAAIWDALLTGISTVGSIGKLLEDNVDAAISTRLATAGYTVPPTVTLIADAIWNRLTSAITTANSIGKLLVDNVDEAVSSRLSAAGYTAPDNTGITTLTDRLTAGRATLLDNLADLDAAITSRMATFVYTAPPTVALIANEVWNRLTSAITTAGSIGKFLQDQLDVTVGSRLATVGYTAPDNTGIDTLESRLTEPRATLLDNLADLDVAVSTRLADVDYVAPTTPPTVGAIADAVWDAAMADHLDAGTVGASLNGAGSAGDPWNTPLPAAYAAGTAGQIIGDGLDVSVGSRMATFAYTAPDNAGVATLLDRLSAVRATGLDTILAGINTLISYLTETRAQNLDNLDVAVSTRLADADYTAPDNGGISTLTGLLTGPRAAALDLIVGIDTMVATRLEAADIPTIVDAVWDALTSGMTAVGSVGKLIGDKLPNLDLAVSSRMSSAADTGDPWEVSLLGYGVGSAGKYIRDALALVDVAVSSVGGGTPPTVGAIADAVWDEAMAGHLTGGSTGASLNGAGVAGDPWSAELPGDYVAGSAGYAMGHIAAFGTGEVTVISPVAVDGTTINLVQGDTYDADEGRALTFTSASWPILTGATVKMILVGQNVTDEYNMVVVDADTVQLELTSAQTDPLISSYRYRVLATLANGHEQTLVQGLLLVDRTP